MAQVVATAAPAVAPGSEAGEAAAGMVAVVVAAAAIAPPADAQRVRLARAEAN